MVDGEQLIRVIRTASVFIFCSSSAHLPFDRVSSQLLPADASPVIVIGIASCAMI